MEQKTHTALHIVKGAARKVLGEDAKWTAGVMTSNEKGKLTLKFDRKPTDEELKNIEELANLIIKKDLPILIHGMSRIDADKKYGDEYLDLFPLPESIKQLTIVEIPNWNVNACNKPHTTTTREVGKIQINKIRFRNIKERLEISFLVMP